MDIIKKYPFLRLPVTAIASAMACSASGQQVPNIDVFHVRDGIFMLVGEGGNTTVQVGNDGILIVDTKSQAAADELLSLVRTLGTEPIRYVMNTHVHSDHTGGNERIAAAGSAVTGTNVAALLSDSGASAKIVAHENVLLQITAMEEDEQPPFGAWPTDTYFTSHMDLYFNGEAVRMVHQPNAHTDGDSTIYFRGSDVVSTGDIFVTDSYPRIDLARGGTINGIIEALNYLIDLAVPEEKQEGGTLVVPGHGRLSDESELLDYRDMLVIIRDRVERLKLEDASLRDVLAAQPSFEYDVLYAADDDQEWGAEEFISAVYQSLPSP